MNRGEDCRSAEVQYLGVLGSDPKPRVDDVAEEASKDPIEDEG